MSTRPDPRLGDDADIDKARPARRTESTGRMLLVGILALAVVVVVVVLLA